MEESGEHVEDRPHENFLISLYKLFSKYLSQGLRILFIDVRMLGGNLLRWQVL